MAPLQTDTRAVMDPKFRNHRTIDASRANAWREQADLPQLSDHTNDFACKFGYWDCESSPYLPAKLTNFSNVAPEQLCNWLSMVRDPQWVDEVSTEVAFAELPDATFPDLIAKQ